MDQNSALKSLSEGWMKALASFQTLGTQGGAAAPQLSFSPDKLEALQKQYMTEATELWNQSLHGAPVVKDRRFSGDAWAQNPVAAFAAAAAACALARCSRMIATLSLGTTSSGSTPSMSE